MKLTDKENMAVKMSPKMRLKGARYTDGLYMDSSTKKKIIYNRQTYVGTSMWDVSKITMI